MKSCGCYRREIGDRTRTHGQSKSREFAAWSNMLDRCLNQRNGDYANYGGRGITVCDRWRESFENFLADMGQRPSPAHSLDRIDNDGPYAPGNCRWATADTQRQNNRQRVVYIEHAGERLPLTAWARRLSMTPAALRRRLRRGSVAEALTTPRRRIIA